MFGQNVVLRHPHKIHIGDNVVIDDNCLLDAKGDTNRGIAIGSGVFVGRNTILSCKNGDIDVEDGANIGFNCELFSASRVRIGRDTLLAAYCYVIGGDHDFSDPAVAGARTGTALAPAWTSAKGRGSAPARKVLDGVTSGAAPSSAPVPWFANRFPTVRSRSASRRGSLVSGQRGKGPCGS